MSIGTGIVSGLAAAGCWGGDDYCGGIATRYSGSTFLTLFWVQVFALVAFVALLPTGLLAMDRPSPAAIGAAAGLNVLVLAGAGLIYRACAIGKMALVAPIAGGYAVISALLALVAGEHLATLPLIGIGVTLAAIFVISITPNVSGPTKADNAADVSIDVPPEVRSVAHPIDKGTFNAVPFLRPLWKLYLRLEPGLVEAILAMIIWGFAFWALRYPVEALGSMQVVFIGKVGNLLLLALIAGVGMLLERVHLRGVSGDGHWYDVRVRHSMFWWFVIPTAALDVGANVAFVLGLATSLTTVVTVFAALSGAVTVLLGWLLQHERLAWWQWSGVAVIVVGVLLVNL